MSKGAPPPRARGRVLAGVWFLLILSAVATGYWFFYVRGFVTSEDARLDGDLVDFSPQISGVLNRVPVNEGDRVEKGQVLFTLDKDLLEAAVRQAAVNLDHAEVRAPFSGVVVRTWQKPGAMITAGRPVLTLFNPDTLYVSANVEEKDLCRIQVGDKVDISVDAYPGLKMTGRLEKILLAANSEFSLIPSEGVSGTYIKVAQYVPIRVALDRHPDMAFGPGLSTVISIHVREQNPGQAAASASDG